MNDTKRIDDDPDHFEDDPYLRWHYWNGMKRFQVRLRTHLSLFFAVALAILVVVREWTELINAAALLTFLQWILLILVILTPVLLVRLKWVKIIRQHVEWTEWVLIGLVIAGVVAIGLFEKDRLIQRAKTIQGSDLLGLLVLVITIGTLGAAVWELYGDKLSSSTRDVRFALYVRRLLMQLDNFYIDEAGGTVKSPAEALGEFTDEVLKAACATLCGETSVTGGYLEPSENTLKLSKTSKDAQYDLHLSIPLNDTQPVPGPGALAFKQTLRPYPSVYLPEKERKEAWFVASSKGAAYKFPPPQEIGWVATSDPTKLEDFRSVLCIPVRAYSGDGTEHNMGALTFTTKALDPFLPRDFLMGECFARILGQAIAIANEAEWKKTEKGS